MTGHRLRRLGLIGLVPLSGLALVLAFPPFDQTWLVWGALIPALIALRLSTELQKSPFGVGYAVGIVYFGGTFWWIGHVTVPGTVALVLYLALYTAAWFWAMERWFWSRCGVGVLGNLKYAALGASSWVFLEWWRSWFLTGFNWNNLGVALHANVPLLQLAGLGGVYLLSWLIVFMNVAACRMLLRVGGDLLAGRPRGPLYELSLATLLVALCFAWGWRRTLHKPDGAEKTLRYACVQANIPQSDYEELMTPEETLQRHEQLSNLAVLSDPQLLLWPEATTNLGLFTDARLNALALKLTSRHHLYFLLGATDYEPGHFYNAAFLLHPDWSGLQIYHKNNLVIFGEYVPLVKWLPILRKLVPFGSDFSFGTEPKRFSLPTLGVSLAPLICFEDTLPNFVRKAAALKPDILVNITNDSWFKDSPGAEQHLANAVFRAVENDRPMIRCANTGVTCEIDQHGAVRARLTDNGLPTGRSVEASGILVRELRWHSPRQTLYERWGDWVPLVSALVCLLVSLPERMQRTRKTKQRPV